MPLLPLLLMCCSAALLPLLLLIRTPTVVVIAWWLLRCIALVSNARYGGWVCLESCGCELCPICRV